MLARMSWKYWSFQNEGAVVLVVLRAADEVSVQVVEEVLESDIA